MIYITESIAVNETYCWFVQYSQRFIWNTNNWSFSDTWQKRKA